MATLMALATSAKEHGIPLPPAVTALMATADQGTTAKLQAALLETAAQADSSPGDDGEAAAVDADADADAAGGGPDEDDVPALDRAQAFLDAGAYPDQDGLPDNSSGASKDHVVAGGETLDSIAQTYHTSAKAIAYVNDLRGPDDIHPGELLQVPNEA
jgi:hypothetical protein